MKKLAVLVLLACELLVGGCGSGTTTSVANANSVTSGLWGVVLTGGSGDASGAVLGFIMNFTVNGDGSLNVSQFSFNNVQTCFVSETESGTSSLTTTTGNEVEGTITFVVTSTSPSGNTLTLMGNEVGSSITGSWTLAGGTGCVGGGSFTMTKSS
ncbi:MAG TPA: hypothetical protein VIH89_17500 [Candidatus Sulfotelmatobacter sp.]|jgi:hypothetical protein